MVFFVVVDCFDEVGQSLCDLFCGDLPIDLEEVCHEFQN